MSPRHSASSAATTRIPPDVHYRVQRSNLGREHVVRRRSSCRTGLVMSLSRQDGDKLVADIEQYIMFASWTFRLSRFLFTTYPQRYSLGSTIVALYSIWSSNLSDIEDLAYVEATRSKGRMFALVRRISDGRRPLSPALTSESDPPRTMTDEEIIHTSDPLVNASSPSFFRHLPTELLQAIFTYCACDYYSEAEGFRESHLSTPPYWVNVSYVCHHWRNAALGYSPLWTYLFLVSPRWTEEILSRSKRAPLKLRVQLDFYRRHGVSLGLCLVNQVLKHAERIQDIHLSMLFVRSEHELFSTLFQRALRLQNVTLSLECLSTEFEPPEKWIHVDIDTPALRTLKLSNMSVPWYSLKLSSLTALSLYNVPPRFRQNTEEFLTTLSCMQDLRHLYLDNALASAAHFLSSAACDTFPKIDLNHLSRLLIDAPLSTVVVLLSCTIIPPKTDVRLRYRLNQFESRYLSDGYTLLPPSFTQRYSMSNNHALSSPTLSRSLLIITEDKSRAGATQLTFSVSVRDRHPLDSSSNCLVGFWDLDIPLHISILPTLSMAQDAGLITHICRSIPLIDVQSVDFTRPPFSSSFWSEMFGHLPNLRRLRLSDGCIPDLAPVLSSLPRGIGTDGEVDCSPDEVFVPALEVLELHSMFPAEGPLSDSDMVEQLHHALASRKKSQGTFTVLGCPWATGGKWKAVGRWDFGQFHFVSEPSPAGSAYGSERDD